MAGNRNWTEAEVGALREGWGQMRGGMKALAKKLGRTPNSVRQKAGRLHLGPWAQSGELVPYLDLVQAVAGLSDKMNCLDRAERWERMGLHVIRRRIVTGMQRGVHLGDFWRWAKANRDRLDFSRFEPGALGAEPEWVPIKRAVDRRSRAFDGRNNTPWSPDEVALLRHLCAKGTSWAELDRLFRRSSQAILNKIRALGLKGPSRSPRWVPWSDADTARLRKLAGMGYGTKYIAAQLGRTEDSVRGKICSERRRTRGTAGE